MENKGYRKLQRGIKEEMSRFAWTSLSANLNLGKFLKFKAMNKNAFSHDRLVSECFLYTWNEFPSTRRLFFHPMNETRPFKGETQAAYMKRLSLNFALGVVKGVVDLIWYHRGRLHVFDIKLPGDHLSKEQEEFMNRVIENGGTAHTIISLDQFKLIFKTLYDEE